MSIYRTSQADSGQANPDIHIHDFSGGYVNVPQVMGESYVNDKQAIKVQNIDISGKSIRKMRGFTQYAKAANNFNGDDVSSIWYDKFLNKIIYTYGTKWATLVGTTATDIPGATGLSNNSIFSLCRVGSYILGANGIDPVKTWDGVTFANVTTPPATWTVSNRPTIIAHWTGRAFAAGLPNEPDLLYWSALYDPNSWTATITTDGAGALRIGNDGRPIKALIPMNDFLIIIKDSGVYLFSGSSTYNITTKNVDFDQTTFDYTQLSDRVNCVGFRAWCEVNGVAYLWGRQAVYRIQSTQDSSKVQVDIVSANNAYDVSQVNPLYFSQFTAVHYPIRNQIWFSVAKNSGSTGIDCVYVYDYLEDAWTIRNGYSHKCTAEVEDTSGNRQIYSGDYGLNGFNSFIYKQNSGVNYTSRANVAQAMECIYWTSWIALATAANAKVNKAIFMLSSQTSQTITYSYAYDFNAIYYDTFGLTPDAFSSIWNTSNVSSWGTNDADGLPKGTAGTWTAGQPVVVSAPIFGKGRRMQHRFYSNLLDSDFDILEILHAVTTVGYA